MYKRPRFFYLFSLIIAFVIGCQVAVINKICVSQSNAEVYKTTYSGDSVAVLGTTEYTSVANAISASAGETSVVTLISDVTEDLTINKSVTVNFNGFSVNGTIAISSGCVVNLYNTKQTGSISGTITVSGTLNMYGGSYSTVALNSSSIFNMYGGTISATTGVDFGANSATFNMYAGTINTTGVCVQSTSNASIINLYGGSLTSTGGTAISIIHQTPPSEAVSNYALTIEPKNGEQINVLGANRAIDVQYANVRIYGGNFNATSGSALNYLGRTTKGGIFSSTTTHYCRLYVFGGNFYSQSSQALNMIAGTTGGNIFSNSYPNYGYIYGGSFKSGTSNSIVVNSTAYLYVYGGKYSSSVTNSGNFYVYGGIFTSAPSSTGSETATTISYTEDGTTYNTLYYSSSQYYYKPSTWLPVGYKAVQTTSSTANAGTDCYYYTISEEAGVASQVLTSTVGQSIIIEEALSEVVVVNKNLTITLNGGITASSGQLLAGEGYILSSEGNIYTITKASDIVLNITTENDGFSVVNTIEDRVLSGINYNSVFAFKIDLQTGYRATSAIVVSYALGQDGTFTTANLSPEADGTYFIKGLTTTDVKIKVENISNKYTVTYYDSSTTTKTEQVTYNESPVGVTPASEAGKTFVGWATTQNDTNVVNLNNYNIKDDNQVFYAVYKTAEFVVNFKNQNGVTISSQTVKYNTTFANVQQPSSEVLSNHIPTGYQFVCWSTVAGDSKNAVTNTYTIVENLDVYLVIETAEYSLNVENNANYSLSISTFKYTTEAFNVTIIPDTGYTFTSSTAYYKLDGALEYTSIQMSNGKIILPGGITSNVTIKVEVTNKYSATFVLNNGEADIVVADIEYGSAVPENSIPKTPTKTGYTFIGWAISSTSSETVDVASQLMTDKGLSFYAVYQINSYTITFYDGRTNSKIDSLDPINVDYSTIWATIAIIPTYSADGFVYWSLESGGAGTQVASSTQITQNIIVYSSHKYQVEFVSSQEGYQIIQTIDYNKYATEPKTKPNRTGYNFVGWKTTGDDTIYNATSLANYKIQKDTTFNAVFEIKTFGVQFYDGDSLQTTQIVTYGGTATDPELGLKKDGYTFIGWSRTNGATVAENLSTITLYQETKFYAVYSINSYVVKFYSGDQEFLSQTVEHGSNVTISINPSKTGYNFIGWSKTDGGEVTNLADESNKITQDTNFYAVYQRILFNVYFYDGETLKETQIVNYGETATEPKLTLTKTGYTFVGWSKDSKATSADNISANLIYAETTYYSIYTINNYTVTFINEGQQYSSQTVQYNHNATVPTAPTKTGYTFKYWSLTQDGTEYDLTIAENVITQNITLYAVYTINSYNVTFINDDVQYGDIQSVVYGGYATKPQDPTKTGYTFVGWSKTKGSVLVEDIQNTAIYDNTSFYAVYQINSYTVIFKNGDQQYSSQTVQYNHNATVPTAPTKTGYTFKYWSLTQDGTKYDLTLEENVITQNITLYAVFQINKYSVTFINEGVQYGEIIYVDYGKLATLPAEPTKAGYKFNGWYTSGGGLATNYLITENTVFYSAFTINSYTVTFYNGEQLYATQTVDHGNKATIPSVNPTKTGYTFSQWNTKQDGTGSTAQEFAIVQNDVKFYAIFNIIEYSINFYDTTEQLLTTVTKVGYGTQFKDVDAPTDYTIATGYQFAGWSTTFGNTDYILKDGYTVTSDLNVYLIVKAKNYSLTYNNTQSVVLYDSSANTILSGDVVLTYNTSFTFLLSLTDTAINDGYYVTEVKLGETILTANSDGYYTISSASVTDNLTLTITLSNDYYVIFKEYNDSATSESCIETIKVNYKTKFYEINGLNSIVPTAIRDGYTFDGWSLIRNGSGPKISTSYVIQDKQVIVYARYVQATSKYASLDDTTVSKNAGSLTNDIFYKDGNNFTFEFVLNSSLGYKIGSDGLTITAKDSQDNAIAITKNEDGSYTILASNLPDTDIVITVTGYTNLYTVSFDGYADYTISAEYNTIWETIANEFATNKGTPSEVGKTFKGWSFIQEGAIINNNYRLTSDVVVYAVYSINPSVVVSVGNVGFSIVNEQTEVLKDAVTGVDFSFKITLSEGYRVNKGSSLVVTYSVGGVDKGELNATNGVYTIIGTNITDAITVYVANINNNYTVSYYQDDSLYNTEIVEYNNSPIGVAGPTKTGYDFVGWATTKTATTALDLLTIKVTNDDIKLYPVYTVKSYTIAFKYNGNTEYKSYNYGDILSLYAPDASKTGYSYVWINASLEEIDLQQTTVTENATFRASYTANKITITFVYGLDGEVSSTLQFDYDGTVTSYPSQANITGYSLNWQLDGKNVELDSQIVTVAKTYTAVYTANTYTVTLGSSYASINVNSATFGQNLVFTLSFNEGYYASEELVIKYTVNGGEQLIATASNTAIGTTSTQVTINGSNVSGNIIVYVTSGYVNSYSITFKYGEKQDGEYPSQTIVLSYNTSGTSVYSSRPNSSVSALPGRTLAGYSKTENGEIITDWATETVKQNTTYYAIYTNNNYTLSVANSYINMYEIVGAVDGVSTITYNLNTTATISFKNGYRLTNSSTKPTVILNSTELTAEQITINADGSITISINGSIITSNIQIYITSGITNSYNFKFIYKAESKQISVAYGDKISTIISSYAPDGTLVSLKAPGQSLAGWSLDDDNSVDIFTDSDVINNDVIVYACFINNNYSLSVPSDSTNKYTLDVTSLTYNTDTQVILTFINGYKLTNQTSKPTIVLNIGSSSVTLTDDDIQIISNSSVKVLIAGSIITDNTQIYITSGINNNYTFTFRFKSASKQLTVTYNDKIADIILAYAPEADYISAQAQGQSFDNGWSLTNNNEKYTFTDSDVITSDTTIYACFKNNTYNVSVPTENTAKYSLNLTQATYNQDYNITITFINGYHLIDKDVKPTIVLNIGSTSKEVNTSNITNNADDGTVSINISGVDIIGDIKVYITDGISNKYTFTFYYKGETKQVSVVYGQKYNEVIQAYKPTTEIVQTYSPGQSLAGWSIADDNSVDNFIDSDVITGNTTIYACFTDNSYSVIAQGIGFNISKDQATYNQDLTFTIGLQAGYRIMTGYDNYIVKYQIAGSNIKQLLLTDGVYTISGEEIISDVLIYVEGISNNYKVTYYQSLVGEDGLLTGTYKQLGIVEYKLNDNFNDTIYIGEAITGYSYNGWQTASGTPLTSSSQITDDLSVYTSYIEQTYELSYYKNNGYTLIFKNGENELYPSIIDEKYTVQIPFNKDITIKLNITSGYHKIDQNLYEQFNLYAPGLSTNQLFSIDVQNAIITETATENEYTLTKLTSNSVVNITGIVNNYLVSFYNFVNGNKALISTIVTNTGYQIPTVYDVTELNGYNFSGKWIYSNNIADINKHTLFVVGDGYNEFYEDLSTSTLNGRMCNQEYYVVYKEQSITITINKYNATNNGIYQEGIGFDGNNQTLAGFNIIPIASCTAQVNGDGSYSLTKNLSLKFSVQLNNGYRVIPGANIEVGYVNKANFSYFVSDGTTGYTKLNVSDGVYSIDYSLTGYNIVIVVKNVSNIYSITYDKSADNQETQNKYVITPSEENSYTTFRYDENNKITISILINNPDYYSYVMVYQNDLLLSGTQTHEAGILKNVTYTFDTVNDITLKLDLVEHKKSLLTSTEYNSKTYYELNGKEQLDCLAFVINNNIDTSFKTANYYLTSNIDISASSTFSGIGTVNNMFSGTIHGGGYEISLSINSNQTYVGFINYADSAIITDLGISGSINSTISEYTGGFIGYAKGQTQIINCYSYTNGNALIGYVAGNSVVTINTAGESNKAVGYCSDYSKIDYYKINEDVQDVANTLNSYITNDTDKIYNYFKIVDNKLTLNRNWNYITSVEYKKYKIHLQGADAYILSNGSELSSIDNSNYENYLYDYQFIYVLVDTNSQNVSYKNAIGDDIYLYLYCTLPVSGEGDVVLFENYSISLYNNGSNTLKTNVYPNSNKDEFDNLKDNHFISLDKYILYAVDPTKFTPSIQEGLPNYNGYTGLLNDEESNLFYIIKLRCEASNSVYYYLQSYYDGISSNNVYGQAYLYGKDDNGDLILNSKQFLYFNSSFVLSNDSKNFRISVLPKSGFVVESIIIQNKEGSTVYYSFNGADLDFIATKNGDYGSSGNEYYIIVTYKPAVYTFNLVIDNGNYDSLNSEYYNISNSNVDFGGSALITIKDMPSAKYSNAKIYNLITGNYEYINLSNIVINEEFITKYVPNNGVVVTIVAEFIPLHTITIKSDISKETTAIIKNQNTQSTINGLISNTTTLTNKGLDGWLLEIVNSNSVKIIANTISGYKITKIKVYSANNIEEPIATSNSGTIQISVLQDLVVVVEYEIIDYDIEYVAQTTSSSLISDLNNYTTIDGLTTVNINSVFNKISTSYSGNDYRFLGYKVLRYKDETKTSTEYVQFTSIKNGKFVDEAGIEIEFNLDSYIVNGRLKIVSVYVKQLLLTINQQATVNGNPGTFAIAIYSPITNSTSTITNISEYSGYIDYKSIVSISNPIVNIAFSFDGFSKIANTDIQQGYQISYKLTQNTQITLNYISQEVSINLDSEKTDNSFDYELLVSGLIQEQTSDIKIGDSISVKYNNTFIKQVTKISLYTSSGELVGTVDGNYANYELDQELISKLSNGYYFKTESKLTSLFIIVFIVLPSVMVVVLALVVFMLIRTKKLKKLARASLEGKMKTDVTRNVSSFITDLKAGKNVGQISDADIKKEMRDKNKGGF